METLKIKKEKADLAFIYQKLSKTINLFGERYPELMFICSGLEQIKLQVGIVSDELVLLETLNQYMKDKLREYYVINMLQYKLQQDIESLSKGNEISRNNELYVEFSGISFYNLIAYS